jgi:DNA-binding transcriptional regulator YiaG
MYHYRGAGLDNIFLLNGYRMVEFGKERLYSVENVEGLHRAIAAQLINKSAPLTGKEFRFLRIEMDLSQKQLGTLLGVSEQTIASWEKSKTKHPSGPAERIMRIWARERLLKRRSKIGTMLEQLATLDNQLLERLCFVERDSHWEAAAA